VHAEHVKKASAAGRPTEMRPKANVCRMALTFENAFAEKKLIWGAERAVPATQSYTEEFPVELLMTHPLYVWPYTFAQDKETKGLEAMCRMHTCMACIAAWIEWTLHSLRDSLVILPVTSLPQA
jgi:hypothetical protein